MNTVYLKKWWLNLSIVLAFACTSNLTVAQTLISGIKTTTPFITTGTNVSAAISRGKGILQAPSAPRGSITFGTLAPRGFAADGIAATFDTANSKGEYVQFAISPTAGFDLNITGLSLMGNGTIANTTNHYAVAYAIGDTSQFNSGNATFIDSAGKTGNILYTTVGYLASGADTIGQKISVLNGSTIYLRVYIWGAAARTNNSQFTITRFVLNGTATASKATFSTTTASICFGASYLFNDSLYTTAGTYTIHKTNSVGADSAATLKLTVGVAPKINTPISLTGCKSVTYNKVTYSKPGVYIDTLKNSAGCDSLYTTLTVTFDCTPILTSFTPTYAAYGDTVVLTGKNFTGATSVTFGGVKAISFSAVNDTTIYALVDTGASGSIAVTTANGTVSLAGFTFNSAAIISGIKTTTPFIAPGKNVKAAITSGKGILQLPSAPRKSITFGTRIPNGGGFAADGITATYDTANNKGEYVQFEVSPADGFDLNITGITLTGNGTIANTTNHYAVALAVGDTTLFNNGGTTFLDSAGIAGNILNRTVGYLVSGADTIGQNIKVANGLTAYLRVYLWGAAARTNNSQFTITNFAINGKTVKGSPKQTFSTTTVSICYGGSYLFNDSLYTTAGTYTIHKTNSVGGDSAATLKLTVGVAPKTNTPITLIGCKSVTYKNIIYTNSTVLTDTAKNLAGCDSVYTKVYLTIDCTPIISSFTPTYAAYGDTVTIKGINFTGATSVSFGSTKALSYTVLNDTTIVALVDTGASGSISIVSSNGTGSLAGFLFNTAAIISGIKTVTPFIQNGKNVKASITVGKGILQQPTAPRKSITFGTRIPTGGGFAADGITATFDTANNKGEYVQFEVMPANGYDLNITGITMRGNGTIASTTNYYAVALAVADTTLFNTGGATFLDSAGITGNILNRTSGYLVSGADTIGQNIKVSNGTKAYIRVYMWGTAARTNNSQFTITDFMVNGNVSVTTSKATFSTTNTSICFGGTYVFNGTTYNKAGTYNYLTKNSVGADSTATLILTVGVAPRNGRPVTVTGCKSVTYKNIVYTTPTSVIDTLKNVAGCDSIYTTVTIAFNCAPTITSFTPTSAVKGDTLTISGLNLSTTSAVTLGGTTSKFVILNDTTVLAVVDSGTSGSVAITTINGTATLAGFTFSTASVITGIKTTTPFINAGKNVSAAISHGAGILQLPSAARGTITFGTRVPNGGGFAADGIAATVDTAIAKGEYVQFAVSPASGYNLNISGITLKGNGTIASTTNYYAVAIAIGDSSLFKSGGATYIDSAGATGNVLNRTVGYLASGADSAGQNINIKNGSSIYLRVYMWGAAARTNNSQFTISNFLVNGASTPIPTSTTYDTICAGSSFLFNGTSYTKAGTYTVHLTNSIGFDSAAILVLTVNTPVIPTVKITSTATTINVGDTVKFTATVSNAGTAPTLQWLKNHGVLWGSTASTYTTNGLNNGDSIFVALFAGKGCFVIDTVLSNIIVTNVNVSLSGTVKSPLGTIIPSVSVAIGTNTIVTDSLGKFGITVGQGSSNVIKPSKINDINKANGINGTDISLIQSHILKKVLLNSPYKLIAGDVNNDGAVNGTDIALIKSLILKHITTFTGNRLWAFVDSSFVFTTPTKPFPYIDSIKISNVATNKTGQNFIGVKLGDVNYDWNASVLGVQTAAPIELSNDQILVDNSATEVRIPVRVRNFKNIMGMQYTLNFNSSVLELKSVEKNLLGADYNTDFASEGKLPFLWVDPSNNPQSVSDNAVLFELVFNKKGNLNNEDIKLSSDVTSINAFDGNYATVGILKVASSINESIITSNQFKLYPNPIKDVAIINGSHIAKIQVIDNAGKVLMTRMMNNATNPSLTVSQLASGAYRLQVQTTDGKVTNINMIKR